MELQTHYSRHHRRAVATMTAPPLFPEEGHGMQEQEQEQEQEWEYEDPLITLSKPAGYLVRLVAVQVELISSVLISFSSPFVTLVFESQAVPSRIVNGGGAALRRLAFGILGAIYASAILIAAMVLAALLGVALVRLWVEEPLSLHRPLHFDYTHAQPVANVSLSGGAAGSMGRAVLAGHTIRVSLVLLLPESDYNRWIGIFQVNAEVISSSGDIIVTSSQPCMLRFQSLPVRLMRTFVMGVPLLVGMCSESQKITIEILRYTESKQKKAEAIRVRLKRRAGTSDLPQIYSADIIVNSQLPRIKELVYNWKWTFYVWISLYMYVTLLIILLCCLKPFALPRLGRYGARQQPTEVEKDQSYKFRGRDGEMSDDFSNALRRWRERRSKRKMLFPQSQHPELSEGSASSPAEGETSEVIDDAGDFAASESSECVSG